MSDEEVVVPRAQEVVVPRAQDAYERGSRVEAVAAVVHHGHHPEDPNVGVVRARLGRGAVLAALAAAAVTLAGVVALALAVGKA